MTAPSPGIRRGQVAVGGLVAALALVVATSTSTAAPASPAQRANLAPTKSYLLEHTTKLRGFTGQFQRPGQPLLRAREGRRLRLRRALGRRSARRSRRILARSKALWIDGNPYYERVEGVVAGTPSLAVYDVILDAGSSAKEDPASAVPFDLKLADGRVLRKPGNLFNLTEGMLWGTRPEYTAKGVKADLDGDGKSRVRRGASRCGRLQGVGGRIRALRGQARPLCARLEADGIGRVHGRRRDGPDDERVLRAMEGVSLRPRRQGARATRSTSSRGSPTSGTSSAGSESSTRASGRRSPTVDPQQAAQTKRELDSLWGYVAKLRKQETAGRRFTPEQADSLGRTAQERATAIAGQVTQAAARLKVKIAQ